MDLLERTPLVFVSHNISSAIRVMSVAAAWRLSGLAARGQQPQLEEQLVRPAARLQISTPRRRPSSCSILPRVRPCLRRRQLMPDVKAGCSHTPASKGSWGRPLFLVIGAVVV